MSRTRFDTRIAIAVDQGLAVWQKLNVVSFLAAAIAHHHPEVVARDFVDASGVRYPGVFRQPVVTFASDRPALRDLYERCRKRDLTVAIYTEPLFQTMAEDDNCAAIAARTSTFSWASRSTAAGHRLTRF